MQVIKVTGTAIGSTFYVQAIAIKKKCKVKLTKAKSGKTPSLNGII